MLVGAAWPGPAALTVRHEYLDSSTAMAASSEHLFPPPTVLVGAAIALVIVFVWIFFRGKGIRDGCNIGGTAGAIIAGLMLAFGGRMGTIIILPVLGAAIGGVLGLVVGGVFGSMCGYLGMLVRRKL